VIAIRALRRAQAGERIPEWLRVVKEANGIQLGFFGSPLNGRERWWAGGSVEKYPDAWLIFGDLGSSDESVRIVAKTEHGERVLGEVAKRMGLNVVEDVV
jgi:hypothetical protein